MSYRGCRERRHRLEKLYEQTSCGRKYHVRGAYFDEDGHKYVRYYPYSRRNTGVAKWLRKQANKKIRRMNKSLRNSQYRKVYEYWWTLT